MSEILDTELEPDPLLVVSGVSDHLFQLNKHHQRLLSYFLIAAKKLILMFWKKGGGLVLYMFLVLSSYVLLFVVLSLYVFISIWKKRTNCIAFTYCLQTESSIKQT